MTHSKGFRCKTRKVFRREFRQHGLPALTAQMVPYKRGDHVDILVNGAVHKGMPHRYYHGKTGVVYNVNPRSIGVEFNKQVGNKFVKKYLHVRVEHLRMSKSRDVHIYRVQANAAYAQQYKEGKVPFKLLKRMPEMPREAVVIENPKVVEIAPVPYKGIMI